MSLRERIRLAGHTFNASHERIGDEGALEIASALLEEVLIMILSETCSCAFPVHTVLRHLMNILIRF